MSIFVRSCALVWLLLLAFATPGSAQQRSAQAVTVDSPPVVDGVLDEAAWSDAPVMSGFIQRVPQDGNPASEATELRILQDDRALYVGVWLYDSSPDGIIPGESVRDYNLEQSDAVLLILDTFRDQQNAFVFGTNPAGIEYDGQVANSGQGGGRFFGGGGGGNQRQQSGSGGGFNLNWDASWDVATSRDARGWYAEFRIPFSTLRYSSGEDQVWGLNVVRRVRRLNEQSFWAPIPREFDQYRLNYAGALEGITAPVQRAVQVTPYALQRAQRDWFAGMDSYDHETEFGGDAKVQVTQGLTLDLTYNTDFAQVEVDEVQTNLSRFNISFPEKRPFFLENAGRFSVGGGGADLFFSRRIGISQEGPVPILGGGRLSGRTAGLNVGLLHIVTDELGTVPENHYSVVRLARELPNRSRIGGAFMRRASDETNDWNRTYAVDGQLGIGEAVSLSSFLARTETPGLDGQDHAFDLQGGYTTRALNATLSYREVGGDFNPELGFLPRSGYRYGQAFVMSYHRPENFLGIREIRPHTSYFEYRDIESDFVQSARLHVDSHFEWQDGMEFHPGFNWVKEGIETPYEIHPGDPSDPNDGVIVPAGNYEGWEAQWVFYTDESDMLSFNGGVTWGSFLSGSRVNPYGTVLFRPSSSFSASVRLDHNDVDLDLDPGVPDTFKVNVVGVRLSYFLTPSISIQSLTQYADRADIWSTNVRFGWIDDAGSGLFVVFNQANGFDGLSQYSPLNRSFVIKYSKLLNVARW